MYGTTIFLMVFSSVKQGCVLPNNELHRKEILYSLNNLVDVKIYMLLFEIN